MTTPDDTEINLPLLNRVQRNTVVTALLMLMAAGIAAMTAVNFANEQYNKDVHAWKARLDIIADSRADNISRWVAAQYGALESVAGNMSLKLYMTELSGMEAGARSDAAQLGYVKNLLGVVAERSGFAAPAAGGYVQANAAKGTSSGLGLFGASGTLLAGTQGFPAGSDAVRALLAKTPATTRAMQDIYMDAGRPVVAFRVPVSGVQSDEMIGMVVGVRPVDDSLFPLLSSPRLVETTAHSMLLRKTGDEVENLSRPRDGGSLLVKSAKLAEDSDKARATGNVGGFSIARDDAYGRVLVTSRAIEATPWVLMHSISYDEALGEADTRRTRIIVIFLLSIVALCMLMVAIWRHGISVRSARSAEKYRQLAERFESQQKLLRLVTDNQPDAMFIVDALGKYRFANQAAAEQVGMEHDAMLGKRLDSVVGAIRAFEISATNQEVLNENKARHYVRKDSLGGVRKVTQARHIPMPRIPSVLTQDEDVQGVLVVEQDITGAISEREKRERILHQLVETLVMVVDRRDPYSAHHSSRVSQVAESIARELKLEPALIETAAIAGNLLNLGKILLPTELLTKKGRLSDEEFKQVAESMEASADFLEGIEFDGPVVDTLRQSRENVDGSGPKGLKDGDILVTAQIVAVANAFVAMASPRAYRPQISREEVIAALMNDIGRKYQRSVVVALVHFLETHKEADWWKA